ncbi:MAG: OmpA family protein, partial [Aquificaceae bacterium]
KAMSGKYTLDELSLVEKETNLTESLNIDLNLMTSKLLKLREEKALTCTPVELARAEAYYDALLYELSKEKPSPTHLIDFYQKGIRNIDIAFEKIEIAKRGSLECYTGEPFVPVVEETREIPETSAVGQLIDEEIQRREEPLMVVARVHFDFNKANIKREYIPLLNEVVKTLKENPNIRIRVEGFTDDIGSKTYNDKLALRRAQAVRDYLIRAGISADRIEVVGFGKERYIADNKTSIGRFTNRRAEFIVIQVPGQ